MDIATIPDREGLRFDWSIAAHDLASDQGLETAVILSLALDRLATADDALPDGSGDRRGWWGDALMDPARDGTPDRIGSRLWLLVRAKQTAETLVRAKAYCAEALQWLIDDGVAAQIDVVAQYQGLGFLAIGITVSRVAAAGGAADRRFDLVWNATTGMVMPATPTLPSFITDPAGLVITDPSGRIIFG